MSKAEIEAKIEFQELIGEANPSEYQPVRFTRVNHKDSPTAHIDISKFQRGAEDENGENEYHPTKVVFRFPECEYRRVIEKYVLMPETYIHHFIIIMLCATTCR